MSKKIFISFLLIVLQFLFLLTKEKGFAEYGGERIVYAISPFGVAEYNDLGKTELQGQSLNLATFKTQVLGFSDTEKIYYPEGGLSPVKVERNVTTWLGKEYLVEDYDAGHFMLKIEKFKGKKKIKEYLFKEKGPIYNALLIPFYLRTLGELNVGWTMEVRIPEIYQIKLDSIEKIRVPAGKFMAYHFHSKPDKFEAWISKGDPRTLLKIKGKGPFGYTLVMTEHSFK